MQLAPTPSTGDGVTDDTQAIMTALNTGHGATPSTDPFIVYLPPGTYLVTGTLPLYFYTFLTADAACRATLLLKPGTFQNVGGYLIDSDVGDEAGEHTNEVRGDALLVGKLHLTPFLLPRTSPPYLLLSSPPTVLPWDQPY